MNRVESLIVGLTLLSWFLYTCRDDIKAWWERQRKARVDFERMVDRQQRLQALGRVSRVPPSPVPRQLPQAVLARPRRGNPTRAGVHDLSPVSPHRRAGRGRTLS